MCLLKTQYNSLIILVLINNAYKTVFLHHIKSKISHVFNFVHCRCSMVHFKKEKLNIMHSST